MAADSTARRSQVRYGRPGLPEDTRACRIKYTSDAWSEADFALSRQQARALAPQVGHAATDPACARWSAASQPAKEERSQGAVRFLLRASLFCSAPSFLPAGVTGPAGTHGRRAERSIHCSDHPASDGSGSGSNSGSFSTLSVPSECAGGFLGLGFAGCEGTG
jgi:hypothetical protein